MPDATVISDALDMRSITAWAELGDASVAAFNAGVDCLLYAREESALEAVRSLLQELRRGTVGQTRLANATRRSRRFASAAAKPAQNQSASDVAFVARSIARASITALNSPPSGAGRSIVIVVLDSADSHAAMSIASLLARRAKVSIEHRGESAHEPFVPSFPEPHLHIVLVPAVRSRHMELGMTEGVHDNVVFLSSGNPYDARAVFGQPLYLTYGVEEPQLRALASVIVGDLTPRGRTPVKLS